MNIFCENLEQTQALAEQIAQQLPPGAVIALNGDLGAGKTIFVRFLAQACGNPAHVHSPTFNILNIYSGKPTLYHFDFYRLSSIEDLENIGGAEFIPSADGITLIEWAEKFPEALPEDYLEIKITAENELTRNFNFTARGKFDPAFLAGLNN